MSAAGLLLTPATAAETKPNLILMIVRPCASTATHCTHTTAAEMDTACCIPAWKPQLPLVLAVAVDSRGCLPLSPCQGSRASSAKPACLPACLLVPAWLFL